MAATVPSSIGLSFPWPSTTSLNATSLNFPQAFSLEGLSTQTAFTSVLTVVVSLLVLEQVIYKRKKGNLPGPTWTIPIIGKFADSLNPTMSNYKKGWETPLSAVSVFNIFIVLAASVENTRKIFNSSNYTSPCLTASAKKILVADNWVFLNGKPHSDYRKGLNVLFTRPALASYMKTQESIYRKFFKDWLSPSNVQPRPYQTDFREINMVTSLKVFCGPYISDEGAKEVSAKYWAISRAMELVNFPLAVPGTKVYNAIQARKVAMKWFVKTAKESKIRMAKGEEPECLADRWIKAMIEAREFSEGKKDSSTYSDDSVEGVARSVLIRDFSDVEIAMVLMSFLFASQDAMTSGLLFAFQYLGDYPEIRAKVRQEQLEIRNGDVEAPLTLEQLDACTYTRAVIKETLRYRPPVIMVPYAANKDFPITDDYTVPKGSMVIPSVWPAVHDPVQYPEPDRFWPERWLEGGVSEKSDSKNWLVYGAGAHRCIGQEYANIQMASVIGTAAILMDWTHKITEGSEDFAMLPTIFPRDECILHFTPREN